MSKFDGDFLYTLKELHKLYDEMFEQKQEMLIEELYDLIEGF